MANTVTRFYTGQPSTTYTTLYTVTAGKIIVKDVTICNASTVANTGTLCFVPAAAGSTGTSGVANAILWDSTFAPNETKSLSVSMVLDSTRDIITARAGTSTLTYFISGLVVV